jgi:predicted nucleic acid-binding protein
LAEALSDFSTDFAQGRLRQADILWRAALDRASELSRKHTPTLGTRSLDVLHVACAMELKLRRFLTLDTRQQKLAKLARLRVISL